MLPDARPNTQQRVSRKTRGTSIIFSKTCGEPHLVILNIQKLLFNWRVHQVLVLAGMAERSFDLPQVVKCMTKHWAQRPDRRVSFCKQKRHYGMHSTLIKLIDKSQTTSEVVSFVLSLGTNHGGTDEMPSCVRQKMLVCNDALTQHGQCWNFHFIIVILLHARLSPEFCLLRTQNQLQHTSQKKNDTANLSIIAVFLFIRVNTTSKGIKNIF